MEENLIPINLSLNNQSVALVMEAINQCCQGAQQSEIFLPIYQDIRNQLRSQIEAVAEERKAAKKKLDEATPKTEGE